jgi:hypothetical protein
MFVLSIKYYWEKKPAVLLLVEFVNQIVFSWNKVVQGARTVVDFDQ